MGAGYEWGFGGPKGRSAARGAYAFASSMGLRSEYSQNFGARWGVSGSLKFDSDSYKKAKQAISEGASRANSDLNMMVQGEGVVPQINEMKAWHFLNNYHILGALSESVSGTGIFEMGAFRRLALAPLVFTGSIVYEMKTGWYLDHQPLLDWLIDTPGDIFANAMGITAAVVHQYDQSIYQNIGAHSWARAAHHIPGPYHTWMVDVMTGRPKVGVQKPSVSNIGSGW